MPTMYVPRPHRMDGETQLRAFVAEVGAAQLVTTGRDGYPFVTLLPVIWEGDRVLAHLARPNPHWREIADGSPALFVCQGPQAYVSPSWYPTKGEHGRVVPTWNYSAVELRGRVTVFEDIERLRAVVTALTGRHEAGREHPWQVTDAPPDYLDGQIRGIVGVEMVVEAVTGKAKLSQNRSEQDRAGVIAGLEQEGAAGAGAVAAAMRDHGLTRPRTPRRLDSVLRAPNGTSPQ